MARSIRTISAHDSLALSGNAGLEAQLKSERLHKAQHIERGQHPDGTTRSIRKRLGAVLISAGCLIGGPTIGTRSGEAQMTSDCRLARS